MWYWLWKWSGQATDPVEIGEQGQGPRSSCFKQLKVTSNKTTIKLISTVHLYFRFTHIINYVKETNTEDVLLSKVSKAVAQNKIMNC